MNQGQFINDKGYILLASDLCLLGILQSRICWFCISRLCSPLAERAGLIIYQQKSQFITNLPIPMLTNEQKERIGALAMQLTETARRRYEVRRRMAHRIQSDLGADTGRLNQRLEAWWELPFQEFRAEVTKTFKRDIPLKDRDDWEQLLRERSAEIDRLTRAIVDLETRLNAEVYAAFALTKDEIVLIEQETKYEYGAW